MLLNTMSDALIKIKVDAYSGYKANERPISFTIREKRLEVKEIIDRWHGEDHDYFKVRADDEYTYIIRYDRGGDEWELVMMGKGSPLNNREKG